MLTLRKYASAAAASDFLPTMTFKLPPARSQHRGTRSPPCCSHDLTDTHVTDSWAHDTQESQSLVTLNLPGCGLCFLLIMASAGFQERFPQARVLPTVAQADDGLTGSR